MTGDEPTDDLERAIVFLRKHEWSIWIAVLSVLGRSASLYPYSIDGDASAKELAMKYLAAMKSDPEKEPPATDPRPNPCDNAPWHEQPAGVFKTTLTNKESSPTDSRPNPEYDVQGLVAGLLAVQNLIERSIGVVMKEKAGSIAELEEWKHLRKGGRYEGFLLHFDKAMEQIECIRSSEERR